MKLVKWVYGCVLTHSLLLIAPWGSLRGTAAAPDEGRYVDSRALWEYAKSLPRGINGGHRKGDVLDALSQTYFRSGRVDELAGLWHDILSLLPSDVEFELLSESQQLAFLAAGIRQLQNKGVPTCTEPDGSACLGRNQVEGQQRVDFRTTRKPQPVPESTTCPAVYEPSLRSAMTITPSSEWFGFGILPSGVTVFRNTVVVPNDTTPIEKNAFLSTGALGIPSLRSLDSPGMTFRSSNSIIPRPEHVIQALKSTLPNGGDLLGFPFKPTTTTASSSSPFPVDELLEKLNIYPTPTRANLLPQLFPFNLKTLSQSSPLVQVIRCTTLIQSIFGIENALPDEEWMFPVDCLQILLGPDYPANKGFSIRSAGQPVPPTPQTLDLPLGPLKDVLNAALSTDLSSDARGDDTFTRDGLSDLHEGPVAVRRSIKLVACSLSQVISHPHSNVGDILCDCLGKELSSVGISRQCNTLDLISLGTQFAFQTGGECKVKAQDRHSACQVVIPGGDLGSLNLYMDNLLEGGKTLPPFVPEDVIEREGRTYALLWKSLQLMYGIYHKAACGPPNIAGYPKYLLPEWRVDFVAETAEEGQPGSKARPLILVAKRGTEYLVVIRGTQTQYEWKLNLSYYHRKYSKTCEGTDTTNGGKRSDLVEQKKHYEESHLVWKGSIHCGFGNIMGSVFPGIREYFKDEKEVSRVIVTGHSLGGAVGTLLSDQIAQLFPGRVDFVGFGAPRVGDSEYVQYFNTKVNARFVSFSLDAVPKVPCQIMPQCTTAVHPVKVLGVSVFVKEKSTTTSIIRFEIPNGVIDIQPSHLTGDIWSSAGLNLQFEVNHTCSYTCWLTHRFNPTDTHTTCNIPKNRSKSQPDECSTWKHILLLGNSNNK